MTGITITALILAALLLSVMFSTTGVIAAALVAIAGLTAGSILPLLAEARREVISD